MPEINKYAKLVILCTLAEQKTLVDISTEWFNNKGRLYQPPIMKEINKAVQNGLLIRNKKYYRANIPKLLDSLSPKIKFAENPKLAEKYKKELKHFYVDLGEYTQKVYLNYEIIKNFTKLDLRKAAELDILFLIQLPFIMRFLEHKDREIAKLLVQMIDLEEYVEACEKLEWKYYYILREKKIIEEWVETFRKLTKLLPNMGTKGIDIFKDNIKKIQSLGGK